MIIQQFLRHRQSMNFWSPTPKTEKTHIISLTCAACMRSGRAIPEPAITVTKGEAVCHIHMI